MVLDHLAAEILQPCDVPGQSAKYRNLRFLSLQFAVDQFEELSFRPVEKRASRQRENVLCFLDVRDDRRMPEDVLSGDFRTVNVDVRGQGGDQLADRLRCEIGKELDLVLLVAELEVNRWHFGPHALVKCAPPTTWRVGIISIVDRST